MTEHREVLDMIDRVLADFEVSDDAMRWTPDLVANVPDPERCEDCVEGIAHHCIDGELKACAPTRCPGCMNCPRDEELW